MTYSNNICCTLAILNLCDLEQSILEERVTYWWKFSHWFPVTFYCVDYMGKLLKAVLKCQRHIQAPEVIVHLKLLSALDWINWPLVLIVIKPGLPDLLEIWVLAYFVQQHPVLTLQGYIISCRKTIMSLGRDVARESKIGFLKFSFYPFQHECFPPQWVNRWGRENSPLVGKVKALSPLRW